MSMPTKKAGDKIEICDLIRQAGIVGAGGAGFPAHVKLSGKADVVIANGVECEPLLETDRHLLLREADRVIIGLKASMKAVGAESGVIAVKRKHSDIIRLLEGLLQNTDKIKIFELDNFYPAGDEHVLLYETTGRVVPMGGIPLNVGAVVSNVHTLALIADSLEGKSFTHRYVTVTGEVNRPAVAKVPIGISIRDAIEGIAGGACSDRFSVIVGGPAMGKLENDLDKPVVKTTGGIIVLPGNHKLVEMKTQSLETAFKRARSVCCQCNFCTEMCPRFLLGHKLQPHKMMRLLPVTDGNIDHGSVYSAALCSECGLCGYYSCTMGLSPNLVNGFLKDVMGRNKI
ncbi:MAG: electron transport complex protein RnfC [Ruminiclostridium sp.]|nr:electron transport complex protein RnfC [Ruminiclostridium sp.]